MADLTNLTADECDLLIDVLEREQNELLSGTAGARGWNRLKEKPRREEAVRQLLWRLQPLCSRPGSLGDAESIAQKLSGYS